MELLTSRPSTIYILPTAPCPLALASTWVSVEKLSRPEPGLPLEVTPVPVTPGASVTSEIILRPARGRGCGEGFGGKSLLETGVR